MSKKENFLDYQPKRNERYSYRINPDGHVEIEIINKGVFNRILQKLMHKPKITYIELEDIGSFLWKEMDGIKTVYELGALEREKFGEKAEPLYERLSAYLQILRNNGYIVYANKIKTSLY